MKISNINLIKNLDFQDYLALPRTSFSGIKSDGVTITPSEKMKFGTAVHQFILEPEKYDYSNHDHVLPVAMELKAFLGDALKYALPEIVCTADFSIDNMLLEYKGRIDLYLQGLVVDLKISEMKLSDSISFFRYDFQVGGYMLGSGARRAIIISYNKKLRKVETKVITMNQEIQDFWGKQVYERGRVG